MTNERIWPDTDEAPGQEISATNADTDSKQISPFTQGYPLPSSIRYQTATWHSAGFIKDRNYFIANKASRNLIRFAEFNEFEPFNSLGYLKPPLILHVFSVSPAMHVVIPVYRGAPFFEVKGAYANTTSDAEVSSIVEECQRRGGWDADAWQAYLDRKRAET